MHKCYRYSPGRFSPLWYIFIYDSDGLLIQYIVRRWNGRFWLNAYQYDYRSGLFQVW